MSERDDARAGDPNALRANGFTDGRVDLDAAEHTLDFTYDGEPVRAYVNGWAAYMPDAPFWRVSYRGADFDAGEANQADTPELIRDRVIELLRTTPRDEEQDRSDDA